MSTLNLLICRNDHSVGLIGKEGSYDTLNDEERTICALVRALGSSQKSGGFGGGTYGFGRFFFMITQMSNGVLLFAFV